MTDVKLVKDCGLYPSYKKIIDFTGTKSEIITKQLNWIETKNPTTIFNVNYNKFQNKLVLEMDYEEALTYTYAVMIDITHTDDKPMFFFINEVENLSNGIESQSPNVAFYLSLDPIMTYMGDWKIDECLVNRSHVDRWFNNHIKRKTPTNEGVVAFNKTVGEHLISGNSTFAVCVITFTSAYLRYNFEGTVTDTDIDYEMDKAIYQGVFLVDLAHPDSHLRTKVNFRVRDYEGGSTPSLYITYEYKKSILMPSLNEVINGEFQSDAPVIDNAIISFTLSPISIIQMDVGTDEYGTYYNLKNYVPD